MADSHTDKEKEDSRKTSFYLKAKPTEHVADPVSATQINPQKVAYEILRNETTAPRSYGSRKKLSPFNGQEASLDIVKYQRMPKTIPLLGRPLGGLEVMYHHTMSKGMDMICLMTKLSTTFPIVPEIAKKALYRLAEQHPLLRMTIQCTQDKNSNQISFLEMEEMRVDFSIGRNDWLPVLMKEIAEPFDIINGPLWKCRLLLPDDKVAGTSNSSDETEARTPKTVTDERSECTDNKLNHTENKQNDFVHEATFLFVWHHSVMDGGYVVWIFKEFAEILDRFHTGSNVDDHVSISIPPPLEYVLECPAPLMKKQLNVSPESCAKFTSSVRPDSSNSSFDTLEDYNRRFSTEIAHSLHRSPRNECIVYEFNERETAQILRICKTEGASTNGIFSTASLLAFIDLLYPLPQRNHFRIPFEFMLDFRKHLPLKTVDGSRKYFPGVASIHIPMMADIQLSSRPVTKREFWAMSRSFGSAIQNEVHSQEAFHWISDVVKETASSQQQKPVGKSPYVLCLSNMGRLDGVLTGDIAKRMKLTGLHGHPTVLIEDSPIFFVSIFSLNGKLCGNVSFCENYTSRKTAAEYIGHFKKHILSQAKL